MKSVAMPPVDDVTFVEVLGRQTAAFPDHVLCRFAGQEWTLSTLDAASNRVARGLLAAGFRAGDRIGVMLPGHPDHVLCLFALMKAGLVRVPLNTGLVGASLAYPFEAFAIDGVIADVAYREALLPVLGDRRVFWRGEASFTALMAFPDASCPAFPVADDILAITPSSGTTGAPKGVLKSDRTLRAGAMTVLRVTEAQAGDVFLFWEALHHGAGVAVLMAAVLQRLTLGMVERFSASGIWRQAKAMGAARVHYLGSVLSMILRQPETADDRTHGVPIAWGGGCPAELWTPFEERFGVRIREGYGLSEMITFTTLNLEGRVGSVGVPLSWYEAAVMDEAGRTCASGEPGELCFRFADPRLGFLGYFRNEAASAATMRDGWFRTGDLAQQDEDGFLYFTGRAKDCVRRRGVNISAWEIERVIIDHPAIAEVAVIGVPGELGDDEIKLLVRLAEGQRVDAPSLLAWCDGRMPKFQVPRFVGFVEDFPRTPTQRIRKMELGKDTAGCFDSMAGQ